MLSFMVQVAGVSHGERQKALSYAQRQGLRSVTLRREPENEADTNAIAILISTDLGKIRVGYIPNRAKCLVCDPQQKSHGVASYQVRPDYSCPSCGGRMDPGTADKIARYFDQGRHVDARIIRFVGGDDNKPTKGMTVEVNIESEEEGWWNA